ncbi:MAG TPA: hypothetical protein VI756_12540 [Blastocatellia bacterium]
MVTKTLPEITALEVEAIASLFLADNMPDRFTAGEPRLQSDGETWRVPVLLAYPRVGPIGEVGQIVVSADSKQILSYTPVEAMKVSGRSLYEQNRSQTRAINF